LMRGICNFDLTLALSSGAGEGTAHSPEDRIFF